MLFHTDFTTFHRLSRHARPHDGAFPNRVAASNGGRSLRVGALDKQRAHRLSAEADRQVMAGDYRRAERLYRESLSLWDTREEPGAIRTALGLAAVYLETRQFGRGLELRRKLEALPHDRLEPELGAEVWQATGAHLLARDEASQAEHWLRRALPSAAPAREAGVLLLLGQAAERQGRAAEAEARYRLTVAKAVDGWAAANAHIALAALLAGTRRFAEGDTEFAAGLDRLRAVAGPAHPLIGYAYQTYAEALASGGSRKSAKQMRAKAAEALKDSPRGVVDVSEFDRRR